MRIPWFLLKTFIFIGSSSLSACMEICHQLMIRCDALWEQSRYSPWDKWREAWPVTDERVNQTAREAAMSCRVNEEYGRCLNAVNEGCPQYPFPKAEFSFFMAAWNIFIAKLCDAPVALQRYTAALFDCYIIHKDTIPLKLPPALPSVLHSHNASIAVRDVCRALVDLEQQLNDTARAAVTGSCGEDGLRILLEGTGFLHKSNCLELNADRNGHLFGKNLMFDSCCELRAGA
ncbi:uncharacterized protein LOC129596920 isoform X2 [Paramacrobiotus metropolitanus]|uniref:uncharacterized protein LOC129596920 isoform X2 n=1 Tax=Paramacrobiotus metropolitanus TaxID=2943436 RepID=UPI002445D0A6|nr:uncharacterized protein LOC129596920 isoform X2 [Paramacrobiotus metropolitanus]